jgi:hypothetical protein
MLSSKGTSNFASKLLNTQNSYKEWSMTLSVYVKAGETHSLCLISVFLAGFFKDGIYQSLCRISAAILVRQKKTFGGQRQMQTPDHTECVAPE